MPTEIRIVTTELSEMARRSFFGEGNILNAFWRDYGLSPAAFTEADIHAISSADGEPGRHAGTLDDSNRAADLIVKLVREYSRCPDASLHVSIVGGRKSVGHAHGSALTFYGAARRPHQPHAFPKARQLPTAGPYPSPEELAANPDVVMPPTSLPAPSPDSSRHDALEGILLPARSSELPAGDRIHARVRLTHERQPLAPLRRRRARAPQSPSSSASTPRFLRRSSAGRRPSPTAVSHRRSSSPAASVRQGARPHPHGKPPRHGLQKPPRIKEQAVRPRAIESDAEFYRAFKAATGTEGEMHAPRCTRPS